MAHACSSELQPAIAEVLPSIAQTILCKARATRTHAARCPAAPCKRLQVVPKGLLVSARLLDDAAVQLALHALGQRCAPPQRLPADSISRRTSLPPFLYPPPLPPTQHRCVYNRFCGRFAERVR
jgi:hypothetical protein